MGCWGLSDYCWKMSDKFQFYSYKWVIFLQLGTDEFHYKTTVFWNYIWPHILINRLHLLFLILRWVHFIYNGTVTQQTYLQINMKTCILDQFALWKILLDLCTTICFKLRTIQNNTSKHRWIPHLSAPFLQTFRRQTDIFSFHLICPHNVRLSCIRFFYVYENEVIHHVTRVNGLRCICAVITGTLNTGTEGQDSFYC